MSCSLQSSSYRTIDPQTAATSQLLKSALISLGDLYALSNEDLAGAFKVLCIPTDIKIFATFIAITNQCLGIGSYALLYNKNLADAIRTHNHERILYMVSRGKLEIPEIFNNERLSKEDIKVIDDMLSLDIESIISYIMNYNPDLDTETYTISGTEIVSDSNDGTSFLSETTGNRFLQKCRNMVCYREGRMHLPIGQENKIYTSIREKDKIMSIITCLDIRKALYLAVSSPDTLNTELLQKLKNTHYKEIIIYKYAVSRGYKLPPGVI